MSQKKQHQEIERTLKKAQDGLEGVQLLWEKFEIANNAINPTSSTAVTNNGQCERLENELKREIKKLQKHRDLFRTWLRDSSIKYKLSNITQAKDDIERHMEQFKVLERKSKTKPFSNHGLSKQSLQESLEQMDPLDKPMLEWLDNALQQFEQLNETYSNDLSEVHDELQSLLANSHKGGSSVAEELLHTKIDELNQYTAAINWHMQQLAPCKEALIQGAIVREQLEEVKAGVDYFFEAHQDDTYLADDELYTVLAETPAQTDQRRILRHESGLATQLVDGVISEESSVLTTNSTDPETASHTTTTTTNNNASHNPAQSTASQPPTSASHLANPTASLLAPGALPTSSSLNSLHTGGFGSSPSSTQLAPTGAAASSNLDFQTSSQTTATPASLLDPTTTPYNLPTAFSSSQSLNNPLHHPNSLAPSSKQPPIVDPNNVSLGGSTAAASIHSQLPSSLQPNAAMLPSSFFAASNSFLPSSAVSTLTSAAAPSTTTPAPTTPAAAPPSAPSAPSTLGSSLGLVSSRIAPPTGSEPPTVSSFRPTGTIARSSGSGLQSLDAAGAFSSSTQAAKPKAWSGSNPLLARKDPPATGPTSLSGLNDSRSLAAANASAGATATPDTSAAVASSGAATTATAATSSGVVTATNATAGDRLASKTAPAPLLTTPSSSTVPTTAVATIATSTSLPGAGSSSAAPSSGGGSELLSATSEMLASSLPFPQPSSQQKQGGAVASNFDDMSPKADPADVATFTACLASFDERNDWRVAPEVVAADAESSSDVASVLAHLGQLPHLHLASSTSLTLGCNEDDPTGFSPVPVPPLAVSHPFPLLDTSAASGSSILPPVDTALMSLSPFESLLSAVIKTNEYVNNISPSPQVLGNIPNAASESNAIYTPQGAEEWLASPQAPHSMLPFGAAISPLVCADNFPLADVDGYPLPVHAEQPSPQTLSIALQLQQAQHDVFVESLAHATEKCQQGALYQLVKAALVPALQDHPMNDIVTAAEEKDTNSTGDAADSAAATASSTKDVAPQSSSSAAATSPTAAGTTAAAATPASPTKPPKSTSASSTATSSAAQLASVYPEEFASAITFITSKNAPQALVSLFFHAHAVGQGRAVLGAIQDITAAATATAVPTGTTTSSVTTAGDAPLAETTPESTQDSQDVLVLESPCNSCVIGSHSLTALPIMHPETGLPLVSSRIFDNNDITQDNPQEMHTDHQMFSSFSQISSPCSMLNVLPQFDLISSLNIEPVDPNVESAPNSNVTNTASEQTSATQGKLIPSLPSETNFFTKLSDETLLFITFHQPHTFAHAQAVLQLKQRGWQFHIGLGSWALRLSTPVVHGNNQETAVYLVQDRETGQLFRGQFSFAFNFVDSEFSPSSNSA